MRFYLVLIFCFFISILQSQEIGTRSVVNVDTVQLKQDLVKITSTSKSRNYKNTEVLNFVASFMNEELLKVCDSVVYQKYNVGGSEYKNVIGSIGTAHKKRIIIGAHYDVCGNQDGADDNGSGIVGMLELARLLSKEKLNYRIDFVAFTLEEPPFFRTDKMGSYIHAKSLFNGKIAVEGMICLEMIGYFSDKPNSQEYPVEGMESYYGNKGDFITVVQNNTGGKFGQSVDFLMQKHKKLPTKSFIGSPNISGTDFSDHLNYWNFNFDAVMITNTAFYRNKNYHKSTDIIETLDLGRMKLVIEELFLSLKEYCQLY